jgi:transitional endoplasmic reticulum ATPase
MADEFTVVGGLHQANAFDDYIEQQTGKYAAPNVALLASIRHHHPDMTVTVTTIGQANLLGYAGAVGAVAELDTSEDGVLRFRGFIAPTSEQDPGFLYDATQFARYKYTWKQLEFILYVVQINAYFIAEYIVFPPDSDEDAMSHSKATDALLMAVGQAEFPYRDDREYILVYDQHMWYKNRSLYYEVLKTTWDDVILDQGMKDTISHTIEEFFDNEKRYRDLDVPWKVCKTASHVLAPQVH